MSVSLCFLLSGVFLFPLCPSAPDWLLNQHSPLLLWTNVSFSFFFFVGFQISLLFSGGGELFRWVLSRFQNCPQLIGASCCRITEEISDGSLRIGFFSLRVLWASRDSIDYALIDSRERAFLIVSFHNCFPVVDHIIIIESNKQSVRNRQKLKASRRIFFLFIWYDS